MPALAERSPVETAADFLLPNAELPSAPEMRKSFDVLASVNMYRYDLAHFGRVLPETHERVQDEELSLMAEGMNRAARTEFVLKRLGGDLMYYNKGEWKPYTAMLLTGRQVAINEAKADPRKQFLADDAVRDLAYGYKMRALQPGEQITYASMYRDDVEAAHGTAFMRSCGRFPDRKMGFLYRAYCTEAGDVILESQTIDRANQPQAVKAALAAAEQNQQADLDTMVAAYDANLAQQNPEQHTYAGRTDAETDENVWDTMLAQRDLITYFTQTLEAIARSPLQGMELTDQVKRHVYGTWAAFKKRIDGESVQYYEPATDGLSIAHAALMEYEVQAAFNQFVQEGQVMVGCGGAIEIVQGFDNIMSMQPGNVYDAIFGKAKDDTDKDCEYISKKCPMPGCKARNVKTIDKKIYGNRRRITGSCGCKKEYIKRK